MARLDVKIKNSPVLANAFRLIGDADLLFNAKSYASTVALGCLAIEEIGKYLIDFWSAQDPTFRYDKRRLHAVKQQAAQALIMVDRVHRECVTRKVDFAGAAALMEAVAAGLQKEQENSQAVYNRGLEIAKWSGMYYDEEFAAKGIEPRNIKAQDATSIMQTATHAFMALAEDKQVIVANVAFGFFHKQPSGKSPAHTTPVMKK
jgi:AbiV family abortive infection protein